MALLLLYVFLGYQPAQNSFIQTNGSPYQPPAPSPLLNGGNTPRTNATVNGTIEYVDASPRATEYINGTYTGQVTIFSWTVCGCFGPQLFFLC